MPVGRWVMRTALSVVLTDWPPGPLARNTSMLQIAFIDLDVDFFGFGQDRDGGGAGVDAAAGFGRRHALHAMHAGFIFQPREHAAPGDFHRGFFDPAQTGVGDVERLDAPAMGFGVALIHAEQLRGEQGRLVPAGAGAHFQDGAFFVPPRPWAAA